ncbi:MAG: xanthine dehydrogenase family protein molybdopterin-binding subunit [Chloroflexi bacterium]|nr:xanthine dehydrogenase family protein molybdopterin-binding subunit [Chloroflexota bacterium]
MSWIGKPLRRFEDRRLVTGAGQYVEDVHLADLLHVGVYRSPYPHARLVAIDVEQARRAPGVVDVLIGKDVATLGAVAVAPFVPNVKDVHHPLLVVDEARYTGEAVAAVLADDPMRARDAADLIEAEWEPLPVVSGVEEAEADGAPLVHPELGTNVAFEVTYGSSEDEVAAAFKGADHVVKLRVESPRINPVTMEPRVIAVEYLPEQDRFLVHPSHQQTFASPSNARTALGLPAEDFDVLALDVGGGFGAKGTPYREELLAMYFAHEHKRSVRWSATRSDDFLTMMAGRDQVAFVEAAFSRAGKLLAMRSRNLGNLGAYLYGVTPMIPTGGPRMMTGAYDVKVARGTAVGLFTHRAPTGPYRGAGRPEAALIAERVVDAAARELGLDPLEIRRMNFIPPDAFPYTTPIGNQYDSGDYALTLDHALELAGYPRLLRERDQRRAEGGVYGIGVCTFVEPAGGAGFESGRVRVEPDGSIVLESGSLSHGQGHHTSFAQVVADAFQVTPDRVKVVQGDSRRVPPGVGTFGSRSMTHGGGAAKIAAGKVVDRMKTVAGHLLEVEADEVDFDGSSFFPTGVPGRGVEFTEVVAAAYDPARLPEGMEPGLSANERYAPDTTYPYGTHLAAVSIDRDTGSVTVEKFVAVDDAGVIVNPLLATAQIVGGIAQGFGQALFEEMVYDENGTLLTGAFGDYAVPRASDLPPFLVGETCTPAPFNTLGTKGLGESGTVGAPPALANAVVDALVGAGADVEQLDFPLTSEKVWRVLNSM